MQPINFRRALTLCAAALALCPLGAQSSAPAEASRPSVDDQRLQDWMRTATVQLVDGEVIATQADWKAYFDSAGVTFVPVLGEQAPRSLPVHFRFESAGRDSSGTGTHDLTERAPEPVLVEKTVHYQRGAGIREQFEVRDEGLKHSVVFDRRPEGSGDLRVRLSLETELSTPEGVHHEGLVLSSGDRAIVGIGEVLGIDARGRREVGWLEVRDHELDLVLPAAFVDAASYPLVVDPLIGSFIDMGSRGPQYVDSDVAYDVSNDTFAVVWQQTTSAQDHDIYLQRLRLDGTLLGGRENVQASNIDTYMARIANVNVRDAYYVVWEFNSYSSTRGREVWGRAVRAANGVMGPELRIQPGLSSGGSLTQEGIQPDVCGDRFAQDDECLVVFADPHDGIQSREITINPDLSSSDGVTRRRQIWAGPSARRPVVCNSGGVSRHALVAWELGAEQIGVRAISMDSTLVSLAGFVNSPNISRPSVDGNGWDFLLAFRKRESATSSNQDIWTLQIRRDPSIPLGLVGGSFVQFEADQGQSENDPYVAMVKDSPDPATQFYGVHYKQGDPQVREDSYIALANGLGAPCGPRDLVRNFSSSSNITSTYAGGRDNDDRAMVTIYDGNFVAAYAWEAFGNGGPVVNLGGAFGWGGTLSGVGPFAMGNPDFRLDITGANNGQSGTTYACFSFTGNPTYIPCGGGRLITNAPVCIPVTLNNGVASSPLGVSCDPNLVGFGLSVQFLTITPFNLNCGLALSASNMLSMTIGR